MIWGIEGAFGSGKTLSMIKFAREFLKTRSNEYSVVTNTPFLAERAKKKGLFGLGRELENVPVTYCDNKYDFFKHFTTDSHVLFLLDEGGVWLNNYNWKIIPEDVYERFTQVRKADIHFIYTVRHFTFVANKLRMMTDAVINCNPIPRVNRMSLKQPKKPWVIIQTFRDVEYYEQQMMNEILEKKFTLGRRWIIRMGDTIKSFDTNKIISNSKIIPTNEVVGLRRRDEKEKNGEITKDFLIPRIELE